MVHFMNIEKKPELLIPACNLEVLKVAVKYGADAVYIGGEMFGLRAGAKNFTDEDMKTGIEFAHRYGKKVYVTANITAHNRDLKGIEKYFNELKEIKPDGVIISDPGVFEIGREIMPDVDLHISTQANNTNYRDFLFWRRMGATRVVTARELSLLEIGEIRANIPEDMEIETFVHGAMCMSYSGRCLLSNFLTGRDANLGACTHPCRWKYYLMEETRPGEYMPVFENDRGTYIFNSKDLCMIEHIPELVRAGIDSFKVEGRMKTALYVATVARTYRQAIDDFFKDEDLYRSNISKYQEEIKKCTYRQFTTGFFFGPADRDSQIYDNNTYAKGAVYLGMIQGRNEEGFYEIEQRNKFAVGDTIDIMKASGENVKAVVKGMKDEEGNEIESCPHPKEKIYVDLGAELEEYDILRIRE